MSGILRKIDLEGLDESFYEDDITPDIVYKLTIEDFEKLGLKDQSLIMKLRIERWTFRSFSPPKGYKSNKFQISKQLLENLIKEGFTNNEISKIVSERTIYRRMFEYGLRKREFIKITEEQLDTEVLALKKEFPFNGELMLGHLLKGRGLYVQRFRLRDTIHHVD